MKSSRIFAVALISFAPWGCAASVSWTIGPASAGAGPAAVATGDHLDPEAVGSLGGAVGEAVRRVIGR